MGRKVARILEVDQLSAIQAQLTALTNQLSNKNGQSMGQVAAMQAESEVEESCSYLHYKTSHRRAWLCLPALVPAPALKALKLALRLDRLQHIKSCPSVCSTFFAYVYSSEALKLSPPWITNSACRALVCFGSNHTFPTGRQRAPIVDLGHTNAGCHHPGLRNSLHIPQISLGDIKLSFSCSTSNQIT